MSFTNYLHKLVFPLIILLLAYLPLAGQTPYVFRHLKVENGLSNNNVKTILKDCEGFLWIGTANGLNRYDGYSFKVYQPKEKDIHSLLSTTSGTYRKTVWAICGLEARQDIVYTTETKTTSLPIFPHTSLK